MTEKKNCDCFLCKGDPIIDDFVEKMYEDFTMKVNTLMQTIGQKVTFPVTKDEMTSLFPGYVNGVFSALQLKMVELTDKKFHEWVNAEAEMRGTSREEVLEEVRKETGVSNPSLPSPPVDKTLH